MSPRVILLFAAAIQLLPLSGPLFLSSDAIRYGVYGHAPSPYTSVPGNEPSSYGPLWTALSHPVSHLGNGVLAFRVIAACSALALAGVAGLIASRKALAVAFVGWNPLVALHFAGGGHNDALMMLLAVTGLLLFARNRPDAGSALWMCSIFIKWIPAFFYVLSSIQRFRRREPLGLAGAAVALVALTAFSWALYGWTWLHAVTHLGTTGIWLTSFGTRIVLDDIGVADHTSHQITTFATFAVLAFFAWTAWRKRLHLGLAAGVLLAVAPSIEPWYVVWCVSLSAVDDEDRWGRILSVVLSGWLLSDVLTSLLHG